MKRQNETILKTTSKSQKPNFKTKQQYEHRYFATFQNGSVSSSCTFFLQSAVTKHEWFPDQGVLVLEKSPLHVHRAKSEAAAWCDIAGSHIIAWTPATSDCRTQPAHIFRTDNETWKTEVTETTKKTRTPFFRDHQVQTCHISTLTLIIVLARRYR